MPFFSLATTNDLTVSKNQVLPTLKIFEWNRFSENFESRITQSQISSKYFSRMIMARVSVSNQNSRLYRSKNFCSIFRNFEFRNGSKLELNA